MTRPRESSLDADGERLLPGNGSHDISTPKTLQRHKTHALVLKYSLGANVLLFTALLGTWMLALRQTAAPSLVYSPAQDAVEYHTVVFGGGLYAKDSPYIGSTPEVDTEWEALYNEFGVSQIDTATAAKLPNASTPLSQDHTKHIVQLDVFHQLHCLNMLRKTIYPDVYPPDAPKDADGSVSPFRHAEHCYDQLRQALMCSSDISTLFWEWSVDANHLVGNPRTTHTCRNFDKIRDWAKANRVQGDLDVSVHVPGAPIKHD